MEMYTHVVQYYETDQMSVVHHSNYIRWMEEARVDILNRYGWDYAKLEASGIFSPITAVEGKYRVSAKFANKVRIKVSIKEFKGVVLKLNYVMYNDDDKVVFEGHSEHCFLNKDGKILRLKNERPDLYNFLATMIEEG